jgi:hypothetical protein
MTTTAAVATAAREEGLYVYCVARGEGNRLLGPIGLDGRPVYTVGNGRIRAVVHDCQAEPYQSRDPQVVQGWVVAHQDVVLAAADAFGTVLPMAFDMIVRGAPGGSAGAALRDWLEERSDRFTRLLEKLAGKAEYGVQAFWDRQAIAAGLMESDPALHAMQREARDKPKGLAHLLQQKLAKAVREAVEKRADFFAQDFYARIRLCVEDLRVDKLKKAEGSEQMLLNLSCLMQKGSGELGRVLEEIQQTRGVSVRFTGPWPPYSFVGG